MKHFFCTMAIAAALFCSCSNDTQETAAVAPVATSNGTTMNIAYINTDSLLNNYEYAKKVSDQLNNKAESARADFNQKARVFQQDLAEFQRKVNNNAFLSMERAQAEQNRLQRNEQELQELNQKLSADLMQEQNRLTAELQDTVINFLKVYAEGKYSLILSNNMGDNILYSATGVDITADVVKCLNDRYAAANK